MRTLPAPTRQRAGKQVIEHCPLHWHTKLLHKIPKHRAELNGTPHRAVFRKEKQQIDVDLTRAVPQLNDS